MAFILKMGTATDVLLGAFRVIPNCKSAQFVCLDTSKLSFWWVNVQNALNLVCNVIALQIVQSVFMGFTWIMVYAKNAKYKGVINANSLKK